MEGRSRSSTRRWLGIGALAASVVLLAGIAGCGNDEPQDADEPAGTGKVDVISATFPGRQYLAEKTKINILVENVGSTTIPNLAVTLDGLSKRLDDPNLADPERPIWIVDRAPYNGTTAYTNTWAIGEVAPGKSHKFTWHVTSVMSGTYTMRYQVAGGLNGKAKVELADGSPAKGSFLVRVTSRPKPVPDPIE
ncbi:MAG: hypothetical protein WDZ37_01680 [Solirubrobacterales bacterium]